MATLIDTSVWMDVFRDTSGGTASRVRSLVADDDVVLMRFNQLELLQGAADEREWAMLAAPHAPRPLPSTQRRPR